MLAPDVKAVPLARLKYDVAVPLAPVYAVKPKAQKFNGFVAAAFTNKLKV
jgi:hypothetical protein